MIMTSQTSAANGFTGNEFLGWNSDQQRGYIEAQLVMATTIATRSDQERSDCIAGFFFDHSGLSETGFKNAVDRISEFRDYHPSSILVVMIENECGAY